MATDSAAAAGSGSGGGSDIKPATASVARAGVSGGDLVVEMTTNPMRESASTRGDTTPRGPGQGAAAAASDETKEAPPHSISEKLNEWGAKFMGSAVTDDDGGRAKAEAAGGMTWAWWRARHFCTMVHKPGDGWRVKWDVAVVVVLVFCLIDIPIRVAFEQDTEPGSFGDVLNIMVDVFFLCDVLVNFRTGYFDISGEYVGDSRKIAAEYVKGWFFIDFLTSVPYDRFARIGVDPDSTDGDTEQAIRVTRLLRGFRMVRLFKLLRLAKFVRVLSAWEKQAPVWAQTLKLIKFTLIIVFTAHVCGCVLALVAVVEKDDDGNFDPNSWIVRSDLADAEWDRQYLVAVYFSLVVLTTVGFGDVTPETSAEIIVVCLVMFVGSLVFGYIIGNVASLMTHEDAANAAVRQKMNEIADFLQARRVSKDLQKRVFAHYNFAWKRSTVFDQDTILSELPQCLRADLSLFLHEDIIKQVSFLAALPRATQAVLAGKLKPVQFAEGDTVFRSGDPGLEMYFVLVGTVHVLGKGGEVIVALGAGSHFGEFALLANSTVEASEGIAVKGVPKRSSTVVAATYVELAMLSKTSFDDVSFDYPEVYKGFKQEALARIRQASKSQLGNSSVVRSLFRESKQDVMHSGVLGLLGAPGRVRSKDEIAAAGVMKAMHRFRASLRRIRARKSGGGGGDGTSGAPAKVPEDDEAAPTLLSERLAKSLVVRSRLGSGGGSSRSVLDDTDASSFGGGAGRVDDQELLTHIQDIVSQAVQPIIRKQNHLEQIVKSLGVGLRRPQG